MELFRQLVGASIGNIKLFEKTQRQAKTDGLTGMLNHRTFYETLEAELRRTQRYGGRLSIIMADVDNLKLINDIYGHRVGDMAIKQIARRIGACIRQIDVAARYGGDEFAIILPNTSVSDAAIVAERMVTMSQKHADDLGNSTKSSCPSASAWPIRRPKRPRRSGSHHRPGAVCVPNRPAKRVAVFETTPRSK